MCHDKKSNFQFSLPPPSKDFDRSSDVMFDTLSSSMIPSIFILVYKFQEIAVIFQRVSYLWYTLYKFSKMIYLLRGLSLTLYGR